MNLVVEQWMEGKFVIIAKYPITDVKQIRHHKEGLELVLSGYIRLYSEQCIIEFE